MCLICSKPAASRHPSHMLTTICPWKQKAVYRKKCNEGVTKCVILNLPNTELWKNFYDMNRFVKYGFKILLLLKKFFLSNEADLSTFFYYL